MAVAQFTGPKTMTVNLMKCHDTAQHELGMLVSGISELGLAARYMYVKFLDAVTYKTTDVVCDASATTHAVSNDRAGGSTLAGQYPLGVVFQTTVPTQNQFGWIQVGGIATFTAGSAAIIAGDPLKPDATEDGDCDEATSGTDENIAGYAKATVADNATGLMQLAIRGM